MKMYWGLEVKLHALLTSAPHGGEWSASWLSCPAILLPRKSPWYQLDRRLSGAQSVWMWWQRERIPSLSLLAIESQSSSPLPISIATELS